MNTLQQIAPITKADRVRASYFGLRLPLEKDSGRKIEVRTAIAAETVDLPEADPFACPESSVLSPFPMWTYGPARTWVERCVEQVERAEAAREFDRAVEDRYARIWELDRVSSGVPWL